MNLRKFFTVLCKTTIILSCIQARALSLPTSVVLQKTSQVPVFVISDSQNKILGTQLNLPSKSRTTVGVFTNYDDAKSFLNKFKSSKSTLGEDVRITTLSLADIYQLNQTEKQKADGLAFVFIPSSVQVKNAFTILGQTTPETQTFDGTPLFVPYEKTSGQFLSAQSSSIQGIPLFFEKEDLQDFLRKSEEKQPKLKDQVVIVVVPLEGVIKSLESSNDPTAGNMIFIPPQKSSNPSQ